MSRLGRVAEALPHTALRLIKRVVARLSAPVQPIAPPAMTPEPLNDPETSDTAVLAARSSAPVEPIAPPATTPEPLNDPETSDTAVLARAEEILRGAIALGREGNFRIIPKIFAVAATENCNLECIMCPGHTGMSGPSMSMEQAQSLFHALNSNRIDFGRPFLLDVTQGEPTLNKNLHLIFQEFKKVVPSAKVSLITNATLPIRGRVREIFEHADRIGISIDGATAETYERIRKKSRFANVIRNAKDIADLKKVGVNCDALGIVFVVMDQNLHELPAMVRLASELGIPEVYLQAVERRQTPFLGEENMDFDSSPERVGALLEEAKAEAKRLGVMINATDGVRSRASPAGDAATGPPAKRIPFNEGVKYCSVPWFHSPRMAHDRKGIFPTNACCHMPDVPWMASNLRNNAELRDKSIMTIYNHDAYWKIREGLLDGILAKTDCKGCQYYDAFQWTPDSLRARPEKG